MNFVTSFILIAALGASSMLVSSAELEPKNPQTLDELEEVAKMLESTDAQLTGSTGTKYSRSSLLFGFGRASKSIVCENYFLKLEKDIGEYKKKVASFNDTLVNGKKFFWSNPINGMRSVSKQYKYLDSITTRYESLSKLSEEDLTCDLSKFRVSTLNTMLFVLQADIKHLIIEDPELALTGIYVQLKDAKYTSNHDYYSVEVIKPAQVTLLRNYYATHIGDPDKKSIDSALKSFYKMDNLVFGRILDSCRVLIDYLEYWSKLEVYRAKVCENSKLDQQSKGGFVDEFKQSAYDETLGLCKDLIANL